VVSEVIDHLMASTFIGNFATTVGLATSTSGSHSQWAMPLRQSSTRALEHFVGEGTGHTAMLGCG
jgi:hypothetical protein